MKLILLVLAVLAFVVQAEGEVPNSVKDGYDAGTELETWHFIIMAIGYGIIVLFLLFVIGRLFYEEIKRMIEFRKEYLVSIDNAKNEGIDVKDVFKKKKKVVDEDE